MPEDDKAAPPGAGRALGCAQVTARQAGGPLALRFAEVRLRPLSEGGRPPSSGLVVADYRWSRRGRWAPAAVPINRIGSAWAGVTVDVPDARPGAPGVGPGAEPGEPRLVARVWFYEDLRGEAVAALLAEASRRLGGAAARLLEMEAELAGLLAPAAGDGSEGEGEGEADGGG